MFRNHFKTAWRNLMKYKFISFINLFGLTIGLTCCLLILTYILNELSYDKYNKNADNIYRVTRTFYNGNGEATLKLSTVSPPFGYYFPTDFPEIQKMTRLLNNGNTPLRYKDKLINEPNVFFADENLFDVFTVDVIKGNPKTALSNPFSVMLTEETARKYFGNEDPINKVLRANNQFDVKVTGIYKDFPANAHLHPHILVSFNTLRDSAVYGEENLRTNWGNNSFFTYIMLPKNYNIENMKARFPAFLDKRMTNEYGPNKPSKFTTLDLQKLTDIHLYSHTDYEAEPNGDIKRVYIFSIIAFFVLLIACINYMNLSTARSALRAKEIGIRKVVGARKRELVSQFLSESILLTWTAIIIAFILLNITLPWLNKVSGQSLSINILMRWQVLVPLFLSPFIIGIISGIYPALFMSSFQPVKTLKGLFKAGGGNISFRKVLVVMQFAISIVLIITTIVVFQQLRYMQNASLGYDKEHLVTMPYYGQLNDQYESFRNTLLQNPNIKEAGRSSRIPTGRLLDGQGAQAPGNDSMVPVKADIRYVATDYDFIPTYGIQMAAGRNFSRSYGTDTSGFIINEAAAKAVGWKTAQDAVGKSFIYGGNSGRIIGVMKDFHFESLHQTIAPVIFVMPPGQNSYNNISIKIAGSNIASSLATIQNTWKKYLPDLPYQSTFLDENFEKLYASEQKQETIFTTFACIAIFIACLGLFGLSAFTISQRVKEIGVRKVLGANTGSIVTLVSKEFLKLVLIAAVIAFPVAWYAMHSWLQDFAYRINIQWWVFIIAAIVAAFIALITVGFQAIKAAMANPVQSLRSE
ncbi:ABC transporter permease [Parafilimonas terrae]|uniref:Putative ABC transport system permease protein n=1 Tax=Parafilimonas terrae TaxID=1465490 RepID=A0A1I5S7U3_9BACT|nr:ABC transporter permease [Parafilimonas terrae]SFP66794.1 putative ABC transport system permease protein [Parafilimonas terrae]